MRRARVGPNEGKQRTLTRAELTELIWREPTPSAATTLGVSDARARRQYRRAALLGLPGGVSRKRFLQFQIVIKAQLAGTIAENIDNTV